MFHFTGCFYRITLYLY